VITEPERELWQTGKDDGVENNLLNDVRATGVEDSRRFLS